MVYDFDKIIFDIKQQLTIEKAAAPLSIVNFSIEENQSITSF